MSWFAQAPDGTCQVRLAAALGRYCHLHGYYREGRQWLDQALARAGDLPPEPRIKALAGAASLALFECDYRRAQAHATEGLRLARIHVIESAQIGRLQRLLGSVARERADYAEALRHYQASRESFLESGDPVGVAHSHQLAGATAWLSGDLDTAAAELTTSLTRLRELDDTQGTASSMAYLGAVALYRGDTGAARRLLDEALDIFGELRFKEGIAWALNLLGLVEHETGQHEKSAPLLQMSLALHRELGDRWRQASVLEALAGVACAIEAPVPLVERRALAATYEAMGAAGS
jgi:tetratricopeptide (TPR) repeat protein